VKLSPLGTSATNRRLVPAQGDRWVWSIWWNENSQGKPAPVPLCPPQIPQDLGSNPLWENGDKPPVWGLALALSGCGYCPLAGFYEQGNGLLGTVSVEFFLIDEGILLFHLSFTRLSTSPNISFGMKISRICESQVSCLPSNPCFVDTRRNREA
jgi:hypothetical protein